MLWIQLIKDFISFKISNKRDIPLLIYFTQYYHSQSTVIKYIEYMRILLKAGVNPNIQDKYGSTPLTYASQNGYIEFVQLLLEYGADVNIIDNNWTALSLASVNNRTECLHLLLQAGANPNIINYHQPLYISVCKNNTKDVILLLKYGADPYMIHEGDSPIQQSKYLNKKNKIVKILKRMPIIQILIDY